MTREEREQALEWFKNRPVTMSGAKKMYDLAIEALSQPEIVRCGECKHNYGLGHLLEFNPNDIVCEYFGTDGMMADDYCSFAERIIE